jgi:hypothetical protein
MKKLQKSTLQNTLKKVTAFNTIYLLITFCNTNFQTTCTPVQLFTIRIQMPNLHQFWVLQSWGKRDLAPLCKKRDEPATCFAHNVNFQINIM